MRLPDVPSVPDLTPSSAAARVDIELAAGPTAAGPTAVDPPAAVAASQEEPAPPHYRWNFTVLTGDASAWFVAMAFVDVLTVLPLFFRHAVEGMGLPPGAVRTDAEFLAGTCMAIRSAGWLLPQLFSARQVSGSPRKKPVLLNACWVARLPFLVAALVLLVGPGQHSAADIAVVLVVWLIFSVGEGFSGVPWTYIISETIPARRRGRLFGGMQIIGGLLAVGAGVVVKELLRPGAPAFPRNFGILFGIAFVLLMVSQTFLSLIREPPVEMEAEKPAPIAQYLREMPRLLREERAFQKLIAVQLVAGIGSMAAPLYTLFATEHLHFPAVVIAQYLSVSMVGNVAGSILWAYLNDHRGPRAVIRVNLAAAALTPWAALSASLLAGHAVPVTVQWLYAASFFLAGAVASGGFTGYTTYLLEVAPEAKRAEYVGLMNTLATPAVLMPILGTWISGFCGAPTVFLLAGLGCAAALVLSGALPGRDRSVLTVPPGR